MLDIVKKIKVSELPSKFVPYPADVEIFYRPFTFSELEDWTNKDSLDQADKLRLGLTGIEVVGMDVKDLAYPDYLFIQILRKLSTFNTNKVTIPYTCPYCGEQVKVIEDIINIEFQDIKITRLPVKFKLTTGQELEFSYLSVGKMIDLASKSISSVSLPVKLASKVKNIDFEECVNLIGSITNADDMDDLVELEELLDFGNNYIVVKCPKCSESSKINLKGVSALAEPFREERRPLQDRIIFS